MSGLLLNAKAAAHFEDCFLQMVTKLNTGSDSKAGRSFIKTTGKAYFNNKAILLPSSGLGDGQRTKRARLPSWHTLSTS